MSRRILFGIVLGMFAATRLGAQSPPIAPQWQTTPTMWESGTYTYDGAGNIVSVGTDQYRYDGASRLVNATANTPSHANAQTFQYDNYGNLLRVDMQVTPTGGTPVNTTTVMAIDPGRNQLLEHPSASICPPGVICVSGAYDAAGNQTSSNGYISYEWDALGNLVKLASGLGRVERYVYDANNERIMSVTAAGNSERREYTLRGADAKVLRELVDTVTSGTHQWSWTKDYVYRSGSLLAAIAPTTAGEAIQHFHVDHLGTPRVITDARGYRLSLHTYLPFGAEATGSETGGERMKFTGHERDFGGGPGEDLDYMHARYFAPNAGRFLSPDPVLGNLLRPQSWNRYAYVLNDPINRFDPYGLAARRPGDQLGPDDTCEGQSVDGWCTGETITVEADSDETAARKRAVAVMIELHRMAQRFERELAMRQRDASNATVYGLMAFVDGVVPFGDPLEDLYSDADTVGLEYSRKIGEYTRDVEIALATAGGTMETRAGAEAGNWVTNNVFRWGKGAWKNSGGPRWHFHLGPGKGVMRHHLPYQFQTWRHHAPQVIKRALRGML